MLARSEVNFDMPYPLAALHYSGSAKRIRTKQLGHPDEAALDRYI